jgi:hypothetical protein
MSTQGAGGIPEVKNWRDMCGGGVKFLGGEDMRRMFTRVKTVFLALAVFAVVPIASLQAQTLDGSNVDSRVLMGLAINEAAVQARMPEGWVAIAFPRGPMAGANLLIGFEDRAIALDAEGKPKTPATARAVSLLGLAKQKDGDGVRLYVLRVYSTAPELLPYGNAIAAQVTRSTSSESHADGSQARTDNWVAATSDGKLELSLSFSTGRRSWAPSKAEIFSSVDPSVVRILDYQQLVDVLQSDALGKPLAGEVDLTSNIAGITDLFDGNQKVLAILDIPVYVRKVFLP